VRVFFNKFVFVVSAGQRSSGLLHSRRERKRFEQHTDEQRRVGPSARVGPELFAREKILSARRPVDVLDRRLLHVQLPLRQGDVRRHRLSGGPVFDAVGQTGNVLRDVRR